MHELYQQLNCEYVNAILEVCLTRHDCTVPFHSYVLYVFYIIWPQIHTSFHSKYTFSSKKISKLKYSQYSYSETQERGLQGVNCKIQKISRGSMPPNSPGSFCLWHSVGKLGHLSNKKVKKYIFFCILQFPYHPFLCKLYMVSHPSSSSLSSSSFIMVITR